MGILIYSQSVSLSDSMSLIENDGNLVHGNCESKMFLHPRQFREAFMVREE